MSYQDKQSDDQSAAKSASKGANPLDAQEAKRTADAVIKEAEQTIGKAADSAREQIKTAQERAKEALGTAEKGAAVLLEGAKERLAPLDSWVRMITQERPYLVVGSAAGASFLAGFLMRRRSAIGIGVVLGFLGGSLLSGSGARAVRQPRKV